MLSMLVYKSIWFIDRLLIYDFKIMNFFQSDLWSEELFLVLSIIFEFQPYKIIIHVLVDIFFVCLNI